MSAALESHLGKTCRQLDDVVVLNMQNYSVGSEAVGCQGEGCRVPPLELGLGLQARAKALLCRTASLIQT